MKTPSLNSAAYAAGFVFAPSEDFPGDPVMPRSRAEKQRPASNPDVYEAKFVKASGTPATTSGWWKSFDLSWLLGRATA